MTWISRRLPPSIELTTSEKSYDGPAAGSNSKEPSPIREISTTSPWNDPTTAPIICGRAAKKASLVAPVKAGETIELEWIDHPGTFWQHELGPMIEYMTKVGVFSSFLAKV
jgi:hypothetical protein